jgi:signal transduction histidine kinase
MPSPLRSAKRSSTSSRVGLLVSAVVFATLAAVLAAVGELSGVSLVQLVATLGAAVFLALYLVVGERRRHEIVEEELSAQASFLESLVESMAAIAAEHDPDRVLQQACDEASRLFDAKARRVGAEEWPAGGADGRVLVVPVRGHRGVAAALRLERERPFEREDVVRATVLADFAARTSENARLVAEAETREAERARLSDQLINAEQEERRRLANELHDGAVQSMSGIALMLDAARNSIAAGRVDEGDEVIASALGRHRDTIRSLRELSFNLEPVVLRDQGFAPAVKALAESVGLANKIQVDVELEPVDRLAAHAQAALYQIIREAVTQAIRRGPPTRISVRVGTSGEGGYETVVSDDAPGERRRRSFEAIEERARTLNGRLAVEQGGDGGTTVRVSLPGYAAGG